MIDIHPYHSADQSALLQLMTELQGFIAPLDPLHRLKTTEDFNAEAYIDQLLRQTKEEHGIILIAKEEEVVIGFIAGTIPDTTDEDLLDHYPAIEGRVVELVVSEKYRGKNVGRILMDELEQYFRKNECEFVRVGCFAPNVGTHAFYEKCGYGDRYIEMLKKLD